LLSFISKDFVFLSSQNEMIRTYITLILVVVYGCQSLTLGEEPRLRVFGNRLLRRIFGLKWDDVTGGWRKLQNEDLDLYSSPNI
jgi:hypothetical protein